MPIQRKIIPGSIRAYRANDGGYTISRIDSWLAWKSIVGPIDKYKIPKNNTGSCSWCNGRGFTILDTFGTARCICNIKSEEKYLTDNQRWRTSYSIPDHEWIVWGDVTSQQKLSFNKTILDAWKKKPEKWLALLGFVGTGKTHLLIDICESMWPWALYLSSEDLELKIFETMNSGELDYMLGVIRRHPILILDDVGAEYNAEGKRFVRSAYQKIVNFRYNWRSEFPTIVSTNMTPKGLREYDPRLASRILDRENSITLDFNGVNDWRAAKSHDTE